MVLMIGIVKVRLIFSHLIQTQAWGVMGDEEMELEEAQQLEQDNDDIHVEQAAAEPVDLKGNLLLESHGARYVDEE